MTMVQEMTEPLFKLSSVIDSDKIFKVDDNEIGENLIFEDDVARNAYSVKSWMRYIDHLKDGDFNYVFSVYERAVQNLPGSYKLWRHYTLDLEIATADFCCSSAVINQVIGIFDKSLVYMNKMPRIWTQYLKYLIKNNRVSKSRNVLNQALQALPLTQHDRLWKIYMDFISIHGKFMKPVALIMFKRYLQLSPEKIETFYNFLVEAEFFDHAATICVDIINTQNFSSLQSKSKFEYWNELCGIISQHPEQVSHIDVESIFRHGISKYTDQVGLLWNAMADYFIRSGNFQKARDIYQEGIETVCTARDFSQVYDTFVNFEEQLTCAKMNENDNVVSKNVQDYEIELEMLLFRLESLIEKRRLLLNSVLLRQNPHNVNEWINRVQILKGNDDSVIDTFEKAIETVDINQTVGHLHHLYIDYALYFLEKGDYDSMCRIFERALLIKFKKVDDLSSVWVEWVEMEIKLEKPEKALLLLQRAVTPGFIKGAYSDNSVPVQNRVYKSLRIWLLYADCEENFGTIERTKATYDKIIQLRIANPKTIINYAKFLEKHCYFEESFKACERGISLFKWPNVCVIWTFYLEKFILRYGGTKLERIRDLFNQCLEACPEKYLFEFYVLYATMEEKFGLRHHAINVYEKALKVVSGPLKFKVAVLYLKYIRVFFSIVDTRSVFEKCIHALNDDGARKICCCFAEMECQLGEIGRSRSLFAHCAQMCDPGLYEAFWVSWKDFEIRHGNEETMREMLRVKRSVVAYYSTHVNIDILEGQMEDGESDEGMDDMAKLDIVEPEDNGGNVVKIQNIIVDENEIACGVSDDDEQEERDAIVVDTNPIEIPSEVFGGLKPSEDI